MLTKTHLFFFDSVVLSNFAFADEGLSFLFRRYGKRGKITIQVFQELMKGIYGGYEPLEKALSLFPRVSLSEKEVETYLPLLRNLGEGEASCLAAALHRSGTVVTDDRAARNFCVQMNLPVTGTIGILKSGCLRHEINAREADTMLQEMILRGGYYSPINKISDIL